MSLSAVQEGRLKRKLRKLIQQGASVSGKQILEVFQAELPALSDPMTIANKLVEAGLLVELKDDEQASKRMRGGFDEEIQYTMVAESDADFILNQRTIPKQRANPVIVKASQLAVELRKKIMSLFGKFLRDDGSGVDYAGAAQSAELEEYGEIAEQLCNVNVWDLEHEIPDRNERMALYLNLYNALVIHGHIAIGDPTTPAERGQFFTKTAYKVGDEVWSLDVIEHVFLRCNKPKAFAANPLLDSTDKRTKHALVLPVDYRIHFALNCGAKSCPPIRFYSAEKLDDQLTMACKGFFRDDTNILVSHQDRKVKLTKLLEWYGSDFAPNQRDMLQAVATFLEGDKRAQLDSVLSEKESFIVEFFVYDWTENNANTSNVV